MTADTLMPWCVQGFSPLRGASKARRCGQGGRREKIAHFSGAVLLHLLHRIDMVDVCIM